MYRLVISPRALRQLKNIKQIHKRAVKLALEDIKEDPEIGKNLTGELTGRFSYRVGVYRIIYKVNARDKSVSILIADHRSTVYK